MREVAETIQDLGGQLVKLTFMLEEQLLISLKNGEITQENTKKMINELRDYR